MPASRDHRNGMWIFRAKIRLPDGTPKRVHAVPGVGRYRDLPRTKIGAEEAGRREIARARGETPEPKRKEPPPPEQKTLASYFDDFLSKYAGEHRSCERRKKRQVWNGQLKEPFGHLTLATIEQDQVDSFVVEQRRRLTKKTVANRLAVLSSLVKYAAERERTAKPRLRFTLGKIIVEIEAVPKEHVEKILALADPLYRAAVLLACEAGLRGGEIRALQWTDLRDGMIRVRRSLDTHTDEVTLPKHDRLRDVPVSERLAQALEALPKRGLWVLSKPDGSPLHHTRDLWTTIVGLYARAGVPRPSSAVHSLRHCFGTELAAQGVPLPTIQRLMGHADVRTTMRYITVGEAQLRDAVSSVFGARRGSGVAAAQKKRRK